MGRSNVLAAMATSDVLFFVFVIISHSVRNDVTLQGSAKKYIFLKEIGVICGVRKWVGISGIDVTEYNSFTLLQYTVSDVILINFHGPIKIHYVGGIARISFHISLEVFNHKLSPLCGFKSHKWQY